jgi:flagellar protein FliS
MYSEVNNHYMEARVLSASPVELVRILYGAAQRAVREARRHLASRDVAARSREISRAVQILVELSTALDREKGGELAHQLIELYDYLQRRLIDANLRQEDAPLAEVERLLGTVAEAWDAIAGGAQQPAPVKAEPEPPPVRTGASGYGAAAFINASSYALAGQSWSA